jgi:hypothetical protein
MARISDYLSPYKVRVADSLDAPKLTATVEGESGSKVIDYRVTYKTLVGETLPSEIVTVTNAPSTLTGFNKVKLSTGKIPSRVLKVRYWKNEWTYTLQTVRGGATEYEVGDVVVLSQNSPISFECTVAGVSVTELPSGWPTTVGQTFIDGTVTWISKSNITDHWNLVGEVDPVPGEIYDNGGTTSLATLPEKDTSGRPNVIAIGVKPGNLVQRQTWEDLQAILMSAIQDIGDVNHKNGDIIRGCAEEFVDGTTWRFTEGRVYFLGRVLPVPEGEVTLRGVGNEVVGISVSPLYSTSDDDIVQRAGADEGVPLQYANDGPDWLYFKFAWGVDVFGQLPIKEFYNGNPKTETLAPERTPWDIAVADKINDFAGSFTVDNFSLDVTDHPTNNEKLILTIGKGTAYPKGFKTKIPTENQLVFDKARDVQSVNASLLDAFVAPGGSVISSNAEPFNLSGTSLHLKVGAGNYHQVDFIANNMSAQDVANRINTSINAYPTSGFNPIVNCTANDGLVEIQAKNGKSLTIASITSDCYSILGINIGTVQPVGKRIYPLNNAFIKNVSDVSYICPIIEEVTHNPTTNIDSLENTNIGDLLGASLTLEDAEDGKWDFEFGESFVKGADDGTVSFANLAGPKPVGIYYLSYTYSRNAVKGVRQLVRVTDAQIRKGIEGGKDNLTFTGATSITKADGTPISVSGVPTNAIRILRVNNAANQSVSDYTSFKLATNSIACSHDTSQLDWSAATAAGTGATGQPPTMALGQVYFATFEFWYHSVEGDFVAADSYSNYNEIDFFIDTGIDDLRDCIDFRTTSGNLPLPGEHVRTDYEFYLPRIDKVFLDDIGNWSIIKGVPHLNPIIPSDQPDALAVGLLKISPYTFDSSWVKTDVLGTPVVNQAALRNVIKRLDNLEYWKAKTDLEEEVTNHPAAADSVGIFTDALTGLGKMDLRFNKGGIRHTAALDIVNQCLLLPTEKPVNIELTLDEAASTNVKKVGKSLIVDYVPELFMEQPYATEAVNCASDYEITEYRGTVAINPPSDCFIDQEQLPSINIDFNNNLSPLVDALVDQGALEMNQTVWGNWTSTYKSQGWQMSCGYFNSYWDMIAAGNYVPGATPAYTDEMGVYHPAVSVADAQAAWFQGVINQTGGRALTRGYNAGRGWADASGLVTQTSWRDGVQNSLIPGTITQDMGTSIANLAMSGRVRTTNADGTPFVIKVEVMNLMPNQDHAITMGGVAVDFKHDADAAIPRGNSGDVGHTYQGKTTVKSDNNGRLTGKFQIPAGLSVGAITVSVFHYSYPDLSNAVCYFTSAGFVEQSRDTTIGMPTYSYISNPLHEDQTQTIYNNYYDPLAQTFMIPDETVYISEAEVFFKTKHHDLPIRLEVRNAVDGKPGPVLLAQGSMEAADCNVSEDGSAGTIFELDTVLGYTKGSEYCVVLYPNLNNTGYSVWTAKVGGIDVKNNILVASQTNDGILFHSPNNRVWEAYTKQDLKFRLYKSNFKDNCAMVFEHISGIQAAIFCTAIQEYIGSGTKVSWFYSIDNQSSWVPFVPNYDTSLGSIVTDVDLRVDITSLGGSYQMLHPTTGIVFLLHQLSADAIFRNEFIADPLYFPNQVKCYLDLDCDGVNGAGVTNVTPYFSYNDGKDWVEIIHDDSDVPTASKSPYYKYLFSTPTPATLATVSNATPMVVRSTNHGFTENSKVLITGVVGNTAANNLWILKNVDADTAELYAEDGTTMSVGNGAYQSGGTMKMAEMPQLRPRLKLGTSNAARTPRIMNVSFIATKV